MDRTVQDRTHTAELPGSDDFGLLFAQLGRSDTVAPLDGGIYRMLAAIETLKQERRPRA